MTDTPASHHILCIEDDRETAALLAEDLSERGYRISLAYDGLNGLSTLLRECPDLVLCDVNLPGISGFGVMEQLHALAPQLDSLPFLFLTALGEREFEIKGRRLGADDYIVKPIDFDLLATIIRSRLAGIARLAVWKEKMALSEREIEALTWSARGKTSDEIAIVLGVSKRTVDFHLDSARTKLNATTRTHAVVKAAAGRIIEP